tara:strand:+ start:1108 stop:2019 length:912 start_codon:yes stop_codon:yes gene_type:complete
MNDLLQNAPTVEVPKLSDRAILVDLNISQWTARKKDKRASAQVNSANSASKDASAVHKNLLSGCSQLTAIKTKANEIRSKHYAMTCPWTDNGTRIVSTLGFPDYIDCMSAMQDEFNILVDEFLRDYEDHIMVAQANLGDLFDDDEYPDVNAVRSKFDCRIKPYPITDVSDWRLDVGKDAQAYVDDAINDYSSIFQEQIQTAMGDIHNRLHDVLSRMSERIDYAGKHDKKIFRDTLLENVFEVVELMKTCNLTNDTQMTAQAEAVEKALRGVSPDALRDSSHLRATTKRKIDDVIKTLPSLDLG